MAHSGTESEGKKDDGPMAVIILIVTAVIVIAVGLYFWRGKKAVKSPVSPFVPPVERAQYLEAREKLDASVPSNAEELKKLLIRRALKTIPILLSLQNDGASVERLYKRGMLTDDVHFKMLGLKNYLDQEFQEVRDEAEEFIKGWGGQIWPQAMQFHQLIQKQAEDKVEEASKAEEQKKKSAMEKRKEREKTKKIQLKDLATSGPDTAEPRAPSSASASASATAAVASSAPAVSSAAVPPAAVVATEKKTGSLPGLEVDPIVLKDQEAERMARQLLEEEEKERLKTSKKSKGGKAK